MKWDYKIYQNTLNKLIKNNQYYLIISKFLFKTISTRYLKKISPFHGQYFSNLPSINNKTSPRILSIFIYLTPHTSVPNTYLPCYPRHRRWLSTQNSHQRPYPFFPPPTRTAPLKQTNKRTNKRKRKKKQARRREEKQWKKERAGGKSEQRASPSRGFIIPHIRRTVDLSLHLIPATVSLSLFLRLFEIDIRFFSFRLVESRRRRRHSLSLSLVFFSSPLSSNSSFSFDEHETKRGRTNGVVETELAWSTWEVRRSD